jgi:hypothetical protein
VRGCAPFEAPDGERAPSADKPLDLILYALRSGQGVQVVRFDSAIVELRVAQTPPTYTCTSASKLHAPEGLLHVGVQGACLVCREPHWPEECCATCGAMVPYHAFPGRGLKRALLVVDAPAATGENLQGPAEDRDGYLLVHIPRATLDAFDEEATRRIILPGGNGAGPRLA